MGKRSASAVWKYFTMFQDRLEIGKCNICRQEIRREPLGATSKKFSNKSLWGHLKSKHKNEYSLAERERSKETEKNKKILKKQEEKSKFSYFLYEKFFFYCLTD